MEATNPGCRRQNWVPRGGLPTNCPIVEEKRGESGNMGIGKQEGSSSTFETEKKRTRREGE